MLCYTTINPTTLELLKRLMKFESIKNFYLVGGTSLALQLGHRISFDLDLFMENEFETQYIVNEIQSNFRFKIVQQKEKNSLIINIEFPIESGKFVKTDLLRYQYPLINALLEVDGLRLSSLEDIITMKLSAIANRGAKKDFFDIYELLDRYSLEQMMALFAKKFPNIEHFHILKSLTYFDDAENDFDPVSLKNTPWLKVKKRISEAVKVYL